MAVALRTNDLQHLFDKFINGRLAVLGVFAANELPSLEHIFYSLARTTSKCCCFVANTDPATKPGQHWVLFLGECGKNNRLDLFYFDSYGMPLMFYQDLHHVCRRLGYLSLLSSCNTKQLQALDSVLCGHYCFLFSFLRAHTMRSFRCISSSIEKLGANAEKRDAALFRLVCRIWGSYRPLSLRPLSAHRNANRCDQCCCAFN